MHTPTSTLPPREGMMAIVRNRRAIITGVQPFDADEHGRFHLVEGVRLGFDTPRGARKLRARLMPQIP